MMTGFNDIGSVFQILLLVLSQLTVFALVCTIVFMYRRGSKKTRILGVFLCFVLNTVLYVLMQVNSLITEMEKSLPLDVPYYVLFSIVVLSLLYNVYTLVGETQGRKTINRNSIKEAFDNLPTGVCFFNEAGLPVLCNYAMHRFSFAVCGKDVQFITDLEECFADDFVPAPKARKDGKVFVLSDGSAWHLEKRTFTYESGNVYTQYTATDVKDLHENRVELTKENEHLRHVQEELQRLSANIVAVTREEEVLNTKMRVHDEMGKCLVAAQKYLKEDCTDNIPDSLALAWQRAVSMIKYSNDTQEEDMMLQIRKTCEYMKISFLQTGELPKKESIAYLLTCAVRECVTNAVRYAEATELYVVFSEMEAEASVTVSNNGKIPKGEVVEGGGLSTLRRRIERAGGRMTVQSFPEFKLSVTVPKGKEGVL